MSNIRFEEFNEIKKLVDELFKQTVGAINDLRQKQEELAQIQRHEISTLTKAKIIEDNGRIIISAPEIIIGNVNKDGLSKGGGRVIIRSNDISFETIDDSGQISSKAPKIEMCGVAAGVDGTVNNVPANSSITMHAKAIGIKAEKTDSTEYFPEETVTTTDGKITIESENGIDFNKVSKEQNWASKKAENVQTAQKDAKEAAEKAKKKLDDYIDKLNLAKDKTQLGIPSITEMLKGGSDSEIKLNQTMFEANTHYAIKCLREYITNTFKYKTAQFKLGNLNNNYKQPEIVNNSLNIEANNILFKTNNMNNQNPVEASLSLNSGNISMFVKENEGQSKSLSSSFEIAKHNITFNSGIESENTIYKPTGDIIMSGKNYTFNSISQEKDQDKSKDKELVQDSKFEIKTQNVEINTNDTEGKGKGKICMFSKETSINSLDYKIDDKSQKTMDKFTEGGKISFTAPNIVIGDDSDKKEEFVPEELLLQSKKLVALGVDNVRVNVKENGDNASTSLLLTEEKATLKAKTKATIDGETEITKNLQVKENITVEEDARIKNLVEADFVLSRKNIQGQKIIAKDRVLTPIVEKSI